jgi:hypothetical protein
MTGTMTADRTGMMMPGMPGMTGQAPMMGMVPTGMLMVPRCTMKMEKCDGGMKMTCTCTDPTSCTMMQNLCMMMQGGMMSCCMVMNGMVCCTCNLTMGKCGVEMTKTGCVMTCTSGDADCCKMIQACCDCMSTMMKCGCTCCVMMNGTPVCCC